MEDRYVDWMRLTNHGKKSRAQMSAEERREYDALGIRRIEEVLEPTTEEERAAIKKLYEAAVADS